MIWKPYLFTGTNPKVFRDAIRRGNSSHLAVWRNVLATPQIREGFTRLDWPIRILDGLSPNSGWRWHILRESTIGDPLKEGRDWLISATGLRGIAQGNILASITLRDYQERSTNIGGFSWLKKRRDSVTFEDTLVASIFNGITNALMRAHIVGVDLCLEQISIVLAKDPVAPLATLTPTLHSDQFYSTNESALCCLSENSEFISSKRTLFLPGRNMEEFWEDRPINLEKMKHLVGDENWYEIGFGDIALYSGMLDENGHPMRQNGIPHISPDVAGHSARLLFLFRRINRPRSWQVFKGS